MSNEELIAAVKVLKLSKAPSSDGIPNVEHEAVVLAYPEVVRKVMQKWLENSFYTCSTLQEVLGMR